MNIIYYPKFVNELDLSEFTAKELDLFFTIISKLKFNREISLTANDVREAVSVKSKKASYKEAESIAHSVVSKFPREIRNMFDVIQVDYADAEKKEFDGMWIVLFSEYYKDYSEWSQAALDLDGFKEQSSLHTKTIFRLLFNNRLIGILNINFEILKAHLNLKYKKWNFLNKYVFSLAKQRLSKYFEDLEIQKEGINVKFTFKAHNRKSYTADYHKLRKLHQQMTRNIGRTLLLDNKLDEDFICELAEIETKLLNEATS